MHVFYFKSSDSNTKNPSSNKTYFLTKTLEKRTSTCCDAILVLLLMNSFNVLADVRRSNG